MASLSSQHHSFDINLATQYSIEEAIIIHHFQHWIQVNKKLGRNLIEGRTWTYQTREEIAAHFPYLSVEVVRRTCEKLVKQRKILITSTHNKTPFDKTLWYAFADEEKFICPLENSNISYERRNCQIERRNCQIRNGEFATPIPNTIPDAKPDSLKESVKEKEAAPPPAPEVVISEKEYEGLVKEFGKDEVNYMIGELKTCAETRPTYFKKQRYEKHYLVVKQWILKDRKLKEERAALARARSPVNLIEKHRQMIKKLLQDFPFLMHPHPKFEIASDLIGEKGFGNYPGRYFKVGDPSFEAQEAKIREELSC